MARYGPCHTLVLKMNPLSHCLALFTTVCHTYRHCLPSAPGYYNTIYHTTISTSTCIEFALFVIWVNSLLAIEKHVFSY
jgi:hypothetical protein